MSRASTLAGIRELWSDLEKLADMTDEEVNAELRKLGVSDEELARLNRHAEELAAKIAAGHLRRNGVLRECTKTVGDALRSYRAVGKRPSEDAVLAMMVLSERVPRLLDLLQEIAADLGTDIKHARLDGDSRRSLSKTELQKRILEELE